MTTYSIAKSPPLMLAVSSIGLMAICIAGLVWQTESFIPAYLPVYLFWLGATLGAQPILMVHTLTGGRWGDQLRPALVALQECYLLSIPLFLPFLLDLSLLFPWARKEWNSNNIEYQPLYLNSTFQVLRAFAYHLVWSVIAWQCRRALSPRQACIGLMAYLLTASFFAVDWLIALEPGWTSTLFGFLLMIDQWIGAWSVALLIMLLFTTIRHEALQNASLQQIANLLLTAIILWFYISFMQYLIVWIADLPSEISWYLHRNQHGWELLIPLFTLLHFIVPTTLVLFRPRKAQIKPLLVTVILLCAGRWLYLYWLISPSLYPEEFHFSLWQLTTTVTIGVLFTFYLRLRLPTLMPAAALSMTTGASPSHG